MSAFSWLQIAGLGRISDDRWPGTRDAICSDLRRLGVSPRLLVCLGPLTPDGSADGFAVLSRRLDELRAACPDEPPAVLALPGDSDFAGVNLREPDQRILRTWYTDHELADQLFWEDDSPSRAAVRGWLDAYTRWSAAYPSDHLAWTRRPGLIPGDAAWRGTFAGATVGLLAVTTEYLRPVSSDDRGVVHPRQIHALCDGDVPRWLAGCDYALLVTTHPPDALHLPAKAALQEHFPPGRLAAQLGGPGDVSRVESLNGAPPRRLLCVPLLDPPEEHGGYLVGRIEPGDPPSLRVWPRALRRGELGPRCTPDVDRWQLDDDGTWTSSLNPAPPVPTTRELRNELVGRGVAVAIDALVLGAVADDETLEPLVDLPEAPEAPLCITAAVPLDHLPATRVLPNLRRWICGASLAELVDKLGREDPPIPAWDGAPLHPDAVLRRRLERYHPPLHTPPARAPGISPWLLDELQPRTPHPALADDPLWPALLAAARAREHGRAHGVLVVAEPGAGKTVWSQTLAHSFRDGALGALGGAAWRSARDLTETIRGHPGASWSAWLGQREPTRAAAFAALEQSHRLVVVVDGLDEVSLADLALLEVALRRTPGFWVATRRPGGDERVAPDITRLDLAALTQEDRHRLLETLGRPDLARNAFPQRKHTRLLTDDTPLQISIIARIVKPGEDPDTLPQDQLFARFFATLLQQAERDRRLRPEGSQLLKLLVGSVVGTLALLWLRDGARPLDATRIEVVLEQQNLPPAQRLAALDALEFGYLLRPIEGGWEFAHRTLAEWAAAAAVHRDVERLLLNDRQAPAERDVLAPFLAEPGPRNHGRWSQLLRFYAPHIVDPVGLLTALIGPDAAPHWHRVRDDYDEPTHPPAEYEVSGHYIYELSFAAELLARCRWDSRSDARRCWTLVARAWLLAHHPGSTPPLDHTFLDGLAPHLPQTLDDLIDLFSIDDARRTRLAADPTPLLDVLPVACSSVFDDYLTWAPPMQQWLILRWANRNEATLPTRWLRDANFRDYNVESEAWQAVIRVGDEPPWPRLKRCAAEWPYHLEKPLLAWFARSPQASSRADSFDHRRIVLGIVLANCTAARVELYDFLATADPARLPEIAGRVLASFDDHDAHAHEYLLKGLLRARAIVPATRYAASEAPQAETERLERLVVVADRWQNHLCDLVRALDRTGLDAVAGAVWRGLPPDAPDRPTLAAAFHTARKWPAAVDLATVLAAQSPHERLHGILASEHIAALRRHADERTGSARFAAVLRLADAEGTDSLVALLTAHRAGDPEYEATLLEHLGPHAPPEAPLVLALDLLVRLPLNYQAALGAPGWRARLLAAIAGEDIQEAWLCVAAKYSVSEALDPLIDHLERLPDGPAPWAISLDTWLATVAALCPGDDHARGNRAIRAVLAHADPKRSHLSEATALALFLTPADVPLLLALDPTALEHRVLQARFKAIGAPAFAALLTLYRAATGLSRRVLHATLLAIADPVKVPLAVVCELCDDLQPDRYIVGSTPGPLGAEFDEPEDQIWHVQNADASLRQIGPLLAACTRARPDLWPGLVPLLDSPSALLRSHTFAALLEHAPWDPVHAMDRLKQVLAATPPKLDGNPGFLLAAAGRAEISGELRDTWSETLRHLEAFLGFQHKAFLVLLTRADDSRLRTAGAAWMGKLGVPAWVDHLAPLLADPVPDVFDAALQAILRLDASRAPTALSTAPRVAWTNHHHFAVLANFARAPTALDLFNGASASERLILPVDLSFTLLDEAAALHPRRSGHDETMFSEFPSACEQLVDTLDGFDVPRVTRWTTSPSLAVRAVARRLLAARRVLDPTPLLASLAAEDPGECLSAAECLVRLHCTAHCNEIAAAWRTFADRRRDAQLPADSSEALWQVEDRLLWAIHGESAAVWVALLDLALHRIPDDPEDMTLTTEGEALVTQGCRILRSLDVAGIREFVAAMEDDRIDNQSAFINLIVARARTDTNLLAELRNLAAAGGAVARNLVDEATRVAADPRFALAERLRRSVFA